MMCTRSGLLGGTGAKINYFHTRSTHHQVAVRQVARFFRGEWLIIVIIMIIIVFVLNIRGGLDGTCTLGWRLIWRTCT